MRPVLALVVSFAVLAGCSRDDGGRAGAIAEFVDQLVEEGGVPRDLAECIADGFFESRSNDEINEFVERAELTDDERAEFARLTEQCAAPSTT